MDGDKKSIMENSTGSRPPTGVGTNYTSETLRLELREGERSGTVPVQEISTAQSSSLVNQGIQKKKTASFQITSVVKKNDGGEDSPDETEDASDILDSSKILSDIEQETPSFSEEYSKSEDTGAPAAVIPTSSQYGITAVVQQNESGGLLTSILPQGFSMSMTKGGIALAEPDGVVTSDTENLSNRFKIVKIQSNKTIKKGRWVCLDFVDTSPSTAVGIKSADIRGVDAHNVPVNQQTVEQSITNKPSAQPNQAIQQNQMQSIIQPQAQSQYVGSSQTMTGQTDSISYSSQMSQPYSTSQSSNVTQAQNTHMGVNQQQSAMQQQAQGAHISSNAPSQVLDNQVGSTLAQSQINSSTTQAAVTPLSANTNNATQQSIHNQSQEQVHQQLQTSASQQAAQQSIPAQPITSSHIPSNQQQQTMHLQSQQQSQQSIQNQQLQQTSMPVQHQTQQQQNLPQQSIQSQTPPAQEQFNMQQDQSPSSLPSTTYQQSQQQQSLQPQQQSSQSVSAAPQQSSQASHAQQHQQSSTTNAPAASNVASSLPSNTSFGNVSNFTNTPAISSIANLSTVDISNMITNTVTNASTGIPSHMAESVAQAAVNVLDAIQNNDGSSSQNEIIGASGDTIATSADIVASSEDGASAVGEDDKPR